MWQPTSHGARVGAAAGTVQTRSTRSPGADDDPDAGHVGRDADDRRRAGRSADRRRLGGLPGVLDRGVADDRLVDLEPAVDDVEQDGLAGREVERVGQERVVLGDDVDLARAADAPGTIGGVGVAAAASHAARRRRRRSPAQRDAGARGDGPAAIGRDTARSL